MRSSEANTEGSPTGDHFAGGLPVAHIEMAHIERPRSADLLFSSLATVVALFLFLAFVRRLRANPRNGHANELYRFDRLIAI
jgi:hypothetical protein